MWAVRKDTLGTFSSLLGDIPGALRCQWLPRSCADLSLAQECSQRTIGCLCALLGPEQWRHVFFSFLMSDQEMCLRVNMQNFLKAPSK